MAIAVPGRRLLRYSTPHLRVPELTLTPLLDFLLAVVLFLLGVTTTQHDCGRPRSLLSAENARSMIEAPLVVVGPNQLLLDGVPSGETRSLVEDGQVRIISDLADMLRNKRALWQQLNPDRAFPGSVSLQIDRDVPALVVKSAVRTATVAGYSEINFVVRRRERVE
ncbi:MAG TPA: biopolymer transporter ExbD [Polyangiaceae bacterium]|nr:biopolymer transporter ExbD [Polyangiaceae bacterium]